MPIPVQKQNNILIDTTVIFPKTLEKYDSIWVIVYWLTKLSHFLLVWANYSSKKLSKINIKEIVRLHGVPLTIISYWNAKYNYKFQDMFNEEFGTKITFITIFHPQTIGQSERMIQVIEDMLRSYVIVFDGHWD